MHLFRHRPLFLCCSIFMAAAAVGFFLPAIGKWALMALLVVGAATVCTLLLLRRCDRRRALLAGFAALAAVAALGQSLAYFDGNGQTRLEALEHQTAQVEGTVIDCRGAGGYMTTYTLSLEAVNGEPADGLALLCCHYVSDLQPGFKVAMEVTVTGLEEAAGDGYDAASLIGDGYRIGLTSEAEETVTVKAEAASDLRVAAGTLRRTLAAKLNLLTGSDAHGLPSALLLGDRSALSDGVRRDFARAGVSHLLAISGLHMTLLFGMLEGLLRLLRVPKRGRAILLGVGAWGYLVLLGFPPSATRAVIMLGMTYLASLLSARSDPLTSLGTAGALILAVTPYAVADAGFWMSFLATLGLVALMPAVGERLQTSRTPSDRPATVARIKRGLAKLAMGVAVGVVAMTFTLFVTASVMGEMSLLSPVATLLLTPLCAVLLLTAPLGLLLSGTVMGGLLGGVAETVSGLMAKLAAWMAEPSWVVVSLRHPAVLPIAAVMAATSFLLLAVRLPQRKRWVILLPMLVGWSAIGGVLAGMHWLTRDELTVTYLQTSSQSDALVMVVGRDGFICDLSNGSLTAMNGAVREAEQNGATEIAVLMLTHYHTRTSGALSDVLGRETVRALWLPRPTDTEDYYLMLACLEKAEAAGIPAVMYDVGAELTVFGGGRLTLETTTLQRSTQPVLLVSLDTCPDPDGNGRLVYCGSAVFESELAERAAELVANADTVIFGNHGPLVKAPYGEGLLFREGAEILLSAEGDTAAWLDIEAVPDGVGLWLGQRRMILDMGNQ